MVHSPELAIRVPSVYHIPIRSKTLPNMVISPDCSARLYLIWSSPQILQPYVSKFIMMTYDHHHGTGVAGPVGPMDWGLRNILLIMEHADNDKLVTF